MKIVYILLIIIGYPFYLFAQNIELKGQVIDKKSNEPIAYSTLLVQSLKTGTLADMKGEYKLMIPDETSKDTVIISALGYEIKKMTISALSKEKKGIVKLNKKVYLLSEVIIKPKNPKIINLGIHDKKPNSPLISNIFGAHLGLFMENKLNVPGVLKSVSFYICAEGKPNTPFRVRIYSVNPKSKLPDENLLNENVIVSSKNGEGWVKVDLTKYNIVFPLEGFFVMAEWIYSGDQYYYSKEMQVKVKDSDVLEKVNRTYYGPIFGFSKPIYKEILTYCCPSIGKTWLTHNQTYKGKYGNMMINADIEFQM
jgi:hypothetical protein